MANKNKNKNNMMEYWHDLQTEKSWEVLKKIKGEFPFTLIGGWAVYLWTRAQKSRDIDVIVDFKTLEWLKRKYELRKNDKMRKYEIKTEGIDIDIYVKYYSQLALPLEIVGTTKIEGFDVAKIEFLLAFKQAAEMARKESEKGEKDRIDIMNLLLKCDVDFHKYQKLLKENGMMEFYSRLRSIIKSFREADYAGMNPRQFKLEKEKLLGKMQCNL